MYEYNAIIEKWIDGDTVRLTVDVGFRHTFRDNFRLLGINTPEVRGEERKEGLIAKEWVEKYLPVGTDVKIKTEKAGKYGRWLVDIYKNDESITKVMLRNKIGEKYEI